MGLFASPRHPKNITISHHVYPPPPQDHSSHKLWLETAYMLKEGYGWGTCWQCLQTWQIWINEEYSSLSLCHSFALCVDSCKNTPAITHVVSERKQKHIQEWRHLNFIEVFVKHSLESKKNNVIRCINVSEKIKENITAQSPVKTHPQVFLRKTAYMALWDTICVFVKQDYRYNKEIPSHSFIYDCKNRKLHSLSDMAFRVP